MTDPRKGYRRIRGRWVDWYGREASADIAAIQDGLRAAGSSKIGEGVESRLVPDDWVKLEDDFPGVNRLRRAGVDYYEDLAGYKNYEDIPGIGEHYAFLIRERVEGRVVDG